MATVMETETESDPRKAIKIGTKTFFLDKDGRFDPADFPNSKKIFGVGLPATQLKSGKMSQTHFTPRVSEQIIEQLNLFQDDKIRPKSKPEFFESVVKAFVNIKSGKNKVFDKNDNPVGAFSSDDQFKLIHIDPNTAKKFLYIGKVAGLTVDAPLEKGYKAEIPLEADEKKFRNNDRVKAWLEEYETDAEDDKAQHTLYKVLKIAGKNTETILFPNMKKGEKLRQLKNLAKDKLQKWAFDPNAADPFDKGKTRSDAFKTGKGTYYFMIKYLRHYLEANDFSIPKQNRSSPLFQGVVSHGKYKKLKATPQQVEEMKVCLLDRDNHPKELISKDGTIWKPTNEDWDDAYFYFTLGMEIGYRAEEALTIPVFMHYTVISQKNMAKYDPTEVGTKKIPSGDENYFIVTLYTRKSKHVLSPSHEGIVYDKDVNELIEKRHKQVEAAMKTNNKADLDRLGIIKTYRGYRKNKKTGKRELVTLENKVHSLIGADGKYTHIGTMLNENATSAGKPQTNRKHLRDIMRHCFTAIPHPLPEEYFGLMPLHAIRHLFAQFWLDYSEYDYGWVARLGHWKTIAELQNSYGFMDDKIFRSKYKDIHAKAEADQIKLGTEKGKIIAKRLSDVEIAKTKKKLTPLDKALDTAYDDQAKMKNEQDEIKLEEKADEDHPLSDEEKIELGLMQEVLDEKPAVEEVIEEK